MPPSIAAAKIGVTTGEWAAALRSVFGEYRAPTGVGAGALAKDRGLAIIQAEISDLAQHLGRRPKFLVGKPGLDGHSNGAEQIATAARDCGFEVVYEGIRLTPARIVNAALEEGVHVIGLSILSGSHTVLVEEVLAQMNKAGIGDVPLVVGGSSRPKMPNA
nr:cobalamin-dependent protein [Iodidimonas nitroreducens]